MMSRKTIRTYLLLFLAIALHLCVSCSKSIPAETTLKKASELIATLPEVQAFSKQLRESSDGPSLIIRQAPHDSDSQIWEFYVGENHPDHTVLWNRFSVDKKTGNVQVYDINSGKYITLSEWRHENK